MNIRTLALTPAAALILICACEKQPDQPASPAAPAATAPPAAPATQRSPEDVKAIQDLIRGERPAGSPHGSMQSPHSSTQSPHGAGAAAPDAAPSAGGAPRELLYDAPTAWQPQPPKNTMRKAQWSVPRAADDPEDGEVVLSHFGVGGGGPIAMNLGRWRSMFTTPDGAPVPDSAVKQERVRVNDLAVTLLDITGRYADAMSRGAATPTTVDFRLLGAVVEGPGGPWFFKFTGPLATVTAQEEAFKKMVESLRIK